jgi:hypothetical protein
MKITSWALLLSVIAIGCVEFKDDDSAAKKTQAQAGTAIENDSDVTAPSYEAFALDTAGIGARLSAIPADDSLYGKSPRSQSKRKPPGFR